MNFKKQISFFLCASMMGLPIIGQNLEKIVEKFEKKENQVSEKTKRELEAAIKKEQSRVRALRNRLSSLTGRQIVGGITMSLLSAYALYALYMGSTKGINIPAQHLGRFKELYNYWASRLAGTSVVKTLPVVTPSVVEAPTPQIVEAPTPPVVQPKTILDDAMQMYGQLKQSISNIVSGIDTQNLEPQSLAGQGFQSAYEDISKGSQEAGVRAQQFGSQLQKEAKEIGTKLGEKMQPVLEQLGSKAVEYDTRLREEAKAIGAKASEQFQQASEKLKEVGEQVGAQAVEQAEELGQKGYEKGSQIYEDIKTGADRAWQYLRESIASIMPEPKVKERRETPGLPYGKDEPDKMESPAERALQYIKEKAASIKEKQNIRDKRETPGLPYGK